MVAYFLTCANLIIIDIVNEIFMDINSILSAQCMHAWDGVTRGGDVHAALEHGLADGRMACVGDGRDVSGWSGFPDCEVSSERDMQSVGEGGCCALWLECG